MIRRTAAGAARATIAASFLRAGVAFACPSPPTQTCTQDGTPPVACADSGAPDLDVAITAGQLRNDAWVVNLQATRAYWGTMNVCDGMVLFTLGASDVAVSLSNSEQSIPLRNVSIASVVRKSTSPDATGKHPVRFGTGAFCVWAAEEGHSQSYDVTVQAFDPQGALHQGTASVVIDCTTTSVGATTQPAFYLESPTGTAAHPAPNLDYCSQSDACVASADLPETCPGQCQCDPDSGGSDDGSECVASAENPCNSDSGGGATGEGSDGASSDGGSACADPSLEGASCGSSSSDGSSVGAGSGEGSSVGNSSGVAAAGTGAQATKGGCAAFPGAGVDLGMSVLTMLGISVALRRRR
jgi:hypothetical protein